MGVRESGDDCAADFYDRIRAEIAADTAVPEDGLPVPALVSWLSRNIGEAFNFHSSVAEAVLVSQVRWELAVVGEASSSGAFASGAMESNVGGPDVGEEAFDLARSIAFGFPRVDRDPSRQR